MFSRALASCSKLLGFGPKPSDTEEDRRAWGRASCERETVCRPASGASAWFPIRVRNISQGGIGLETNRRLPPGLLLSIALPDEPGEGQAHVLACVVRCSSLPQQGFSVGCTFAAVLSDADLARFVARRAKPECEDQRQWLRFPCKAMAFLQMVRGQAQAPVKAGKVRDISAGGLAIEVDAALQVGDLLQVDVIRDDETLFSTLASVVRASTEPDGQHVVGCNFIGELPEDRLARIMAE